MRKHGKKVVHHVNKHGHKFLLTLALLTVVSAGRYFFTHTITLERLFDHFVAGGMEAGVALVFKVFFGVEEAEG